jgi:hypothetical protein
MTAIRNGRIIDTSEDFSANQNKPYTMVIYIGEEECTTCRLKAFHVWDDLIELMDASNITYYFIVKPESNTDTKMLARALDQTYFSQRVFLDIQGDFLLDNSFLINADSPFACLTDDNWTTLYVGDPFGGYETMRRIVNLHM